MNEGRKTMRRKNRNPDALGLLACGSAGAWDITIDEAIAGREQWFARIEGPSVYLQFEIAAPTQIARALRFLDKPATSRSTPLHLGSSDGRDVTLFWDDEYTDRCFLVIGDLAQPIARLVLNGQELAKIKMALRQVRDDLKTEKLA